MNKNNHIKEKVALLIHGNGGHRAEMQLLFSHVNVLCSNIKYIEISENNDYINNIEIRYDFPVIRDKYSKYKTFTNFFTKTPKIIQLLFKIKHTYDVRVILSTGPGISIIPSVFFKIYGAKIIHMETNCRFNTASLSGKIMHYFSNKFYVPNKSLMIFYKKSEYSGSL